MNDSFFVIGDLFELIECHYSLVELYDMHPVFKYKGVRIDRFPDEISSGDENYFLEYQLLIKKGDGYTKGQGEESDSTECIE